MKLIHGITLLSLLFGGLSPAAAADIKAFGVGEKLYYRIHWKNITGGHAMVEVKKRMKYRGRDAFLFQSLATTKNTTVDKFFKVRDKITCWWDVKRHQPLRTIKSLSEGRYKRQYKVDYYLDKGRAVWTQKQFKGNTDELGKFNKNARWEKSRGVKKGLPKDIQDVVSSLFMMRAHPKRGKPGDKFNVTIFDDIKVSKMKMHIQKRQRVKVPAGTFNTIKVKPEMKTSGFFKAHGHIYVYVSDDQYRYPVKVQAGLPIVGNVEVELVKIVKPK